VARIRTIKPGFFTSEDVAALSFPARLTWIGLWTYVDDAGRGKANPRLIKAAIWPLDDDVDLEQVVEILADLEREGRVLLYEVDGVDYLEVIAWRVHQRIDRPTASTIPPPPGFEPPSPPRAPLDDDSSRPRDRKGREGKGKEGEPRASARPAPTCSAHPNGTTAACRACGDARRAHDAWRPIVAALPSLAELEAEERCDEHGEVRRLCPLCRIAARAGVA
jgi:hypothetical protein